MQKIIKIIWDAKSLNYLVRIKSENVGIGIRDEGVGKSACITSR